ncbi:MAG: PIN domain-containing protein [Sulfuritalea sp.]|nr:PIN domain-containing protein [Sulfuritalea sp.]
MTATLNTPKLARPIVLSGMTLDELLERYQNATIVVQPTAVPRVVPNDADDDQVLACALAANAELIVSGDKHLAGSGGQYEGIRIVAPAEAVELIGR